MQDVQHINLPVHDWILIAVQWVKQSFFEQEGQYQQYCGGVHSPSRVNFSNTPFPQIQKLIVLRFTYLFFELVEIVEIQGQLQPVFVSPVLASFTAGTNVASAIMCLNL